MDLDLDLAAKKTVLRQISYGLYAITAAHGGERGVFTANWLSQVSFEPPLLETFAFITRRNAHLSPATRAFLEVAHKRVGQLRRRLAEETAPSS